MYNEDGQEVLRMSFGERLRARREALGLRQSELGERIGVSGATVGNYENGVSSPNVGGLIRICGALECDANTLFRDELAPNPAEIFSVPEIKLIKKYRALDGHGKNMVDYAVSEETARLEAAAAAEEPAKPVSIRHYLVPAAAGYANPVEGEDYELTELPDKAPKSADFCIDIAGDSMEPYIADGSRVYVKRDASVREFDDVGVFFYDGNVFCKQFCVDFSGALYLLSANPAREDRNVRIPRESAGSVVCFGRVILPKRLPRPVYK